MTDYRELTDILSKAKNKGEIQDILDFILTPEEKEQLRKRVLLTRILLENGMSQRDISKSIEVSISTITRCSNALKQVPNYVKDLFRK
jgi:TrpR family trp operon transcriptional repressor